MMKRPRCSRRCLAMLSVFFALANAQAPEEDTTTPPSLGMTMDPSMGMTTLMPGELGAIIVNVSLSYFNVDFNRTFVGDIVQIPTTATTMEQDTPEGPTEEEVDALIQNTLLFYVGVYAEAFADKHYDNL